MDQSFRIVVEQKSILKLGLFLFKLHGIVHRQDLRRIDATFDTADAACHPLLLLIFTRLLHTSFILERVFQREGIRLVQKKKLVALGQNVLLVRCLSLRTSIPRGFLLLTVIVLIGLRTDDLM